MLTTTMSKNVSSTTQFLPSDIAGLYAWYRFNTGITVTGAGVSQWNDQTANAFHFLQGTDANRPPKQGDGTILFNGSSQTLKTGPLSANGMPWSVAIRFKQVGWTNNTVIVGGDINGVVDLVQFTATPDIYAFNGVSLSTVNTDLAVGVYGNVFYTSLNGATGILRVNNGTPVSTADRGVASNTATFSLGASDVPGQWSNIQVVELVLYNANLTSGNFDSLNTYLNGLGV